jgi:ADP-glucose pyrophosphorylase
MIQTDVDVLNSKIHRSTLLSGTSVGNDSIIESCLVGRDVKIGSNVNLVDVVVDHGSLVPDGTNFSNGQWPL